GSVQREQTLNRHSLGIQTCARVVSFAEIDGCAGLHGSRGDFGIESHMSLMVAYVDFCFDTRDASGAYLKLRNLRRGRQLRIVKSPTSARDQGQHAGRT